MSIAKVSGGFEDGLLKYFDTSFHARLIENELRAKYGKSHSLSHIHAGEIEEADNVQHQVRPLFGKGEIGPPCIGDHPDFLHLKGTTDTCYCPITTMFMDIEGSTRLGLLFPLEEVQRIKNAFIQTAIQIVRCFDGHVHRIMGDAVMAYFGGIGAKVENTIIDGINCAAVLQYFVKNVVRPELARRGYGNEFGVRIGLDHGGEQDVLWSSYGYPGMDEVTATSFYVDVAAKLQQGAGRNQALFGQSLVKTIDFPDTLRSIKVAQRDGESIRVPFVQPNHTNADGDAIDYEQWLVKADDYLRCTPVAQTSRTFAKDQPVRPVRVRCHVLDVKDFSAVGEEYHPASRVLPKNKVLKYTLEFPAMPRLPYKVTCSVENHGKEASKDKPNDRGNHSQEYTIETESQHRKFVHWEATAYRGLHYLTVQVRSHGELQYFTRFGVYIE